MRLIESRTRILLTGFVVMLLGGVLATVGPARAATPMASPGDRGGTNVEDVRQLRFHDADGDSHVFEIEELPGWASGERGGALQISPVVAATYEEDIDYLLIHPESGAIEFGGEGPVRFGGSSAREIRELLFRDRDGDGRSFALGEIARGGQFKGMFRLRAKPGRTIFVADPETGDVGFTNGLAVRGSLGLLGIPTTLGEPLDADGQPVRGLPETPCDTCAVRADYFDADGNGAVDRVQSLEANVGCESGQLCSVTRKITVDPGEAMTVEFERTFASGIPQVVQTETFAPGEGSEDRVPALTIRRILRSEGGVTGVMIRNGDADTARGGTVGIQGIVR